MQYRNLDLEAFDNKTEDDAERFRVRAARSPAGEQKIQEAESVTLPPEVQQKLRQLEKRRLTSMEMIELGEDLAAALFPPGARSLLDLSRARLAEDEGLRIRLKLDTYALADLPWEYVYMPRPGTPPDQKGPDGFLVLDRRISLVRYEVLGQPAGTLDPVGAGPLRMVALLANPDVPGRAKLDLDADLRNIQEAVKDVPGIQVEPYPKATADQVLDALVGGAHIFHFAGHGEFEGDLGLTYGSKEGKGYLVLMGEQQQPVRYPAEKLALSLRGRGVRLAVLGACEGGRRGQVNAWTGVVPALTKAGIPAVVGNQYSIKDVNAIAFSRSFYRALAAGESIDAAVTDGRLAIFMHGGDDERDWGVAVLYLRADDAEDGVLFPKSMEVAEPIVTRRPDELLDVEVDQTALRKAIVGHFGIEGLDVLCADVQQDLKEAGVDLDVDLDMVGGAGKTGKVLNLIRYLDNRGHLEYLVKAVRRERPGII